ncbi:hypothetical protein [Nocardiopsis valliformis]|uniref:hypothetical protein n=1 Tax=Nocardiopsis valliformis TaxID=239974 RepID=UPI0003482634|nr:hypothetical protein [Nocardiopsis valliformis]
MIGNVFTFAQEEIVVPDYSAPVLWWLLAIVLTSFAIGGSYELYRKIKHEREKLK